MPHRAPPPPPPPPVTLPSSTSTSTSTPTSTSASGPGPISRESTPSPTEPSLRTPPLTPRELNLDLDLGVDILATPTASPSGPHRIGRRRTGTIVARCPSDLIGEHEHKNGSGSGSGGAMGAGASAGPSGSGSASGSGTVRRASVRRTDAPASPSTAARRVSAREDDALMMRDRDEGSIGRAGGVDVGVTRPKRRLSSLPSLPHPFHAANRVLSQSSPPSSPSRHVHSTYAALAQTLPQPPYQRATQQRMQDRMDEKSGGPHVQGYFPAQSPPPQVKEASPRLFGIELKWISLITLALQNAFLTIIMHYSRITSAPNKTYSAASAVLLNELLKGSISVFIALRNIDASLSSPSHPLSEKGALRSQPLPPRGSLSLFHASRLRALRTAVFSPDCVKLSIPAILYVIQNNLQYVAASNLDVATFQVTYQMKILTTAAFSVLLLRKRLSTTKWLALVLLAAGVGIVQIQTTTAPARAVGTEGSLQTLHHAMSPFKGFMAVTAACMTSGLAGVFFELILKANPGPGAAAAPQPPTDLWVRNTQLSLFSLVPAILPILWGSTGDALGPIGRLMAAFSNFNMWAIGTVLTQTLGGLITAVVIRYSDNIMKGFATSLSIIISFLASVALFSYPITVAFVLGSSIVLAATFMYNAPAPAPSTRKDVALPPGSPISTSAPILGAPTPEKPSRTSSVISLLGIGSSRPGSRAPSRAPSGENLRHMASLSSLTAANASGTWGGYGQQQHVYAASAPGTPYLSSSSAYGSSTSLASGAGVGVHGYGSHGSVQQALPLPVPARGPVGPPPRLSRKTSDELASASGASSARSSLSGPSILPSGVIGDGRASPRPSLRVEVGVI